MPPATRTDEELYQESARNPEAFGMVFDRYIDAFVRKATYVLGDREEAMDAAQEAMVRLYGAAGRYVPQRNIPFKAFAYRILMNVCISLIRKRSARPFLALSDEAAEFVADDSVAREHARYVEQDWLTSLVIRLPDTLRRTVGLVVEAGKSIREVAEAEGVSEVAVRVRLSRAAKEMRKMALALEHAHPRS